MTTWAVLPVKPFHRAKSRLRAALADSDCAALAEAMTRRVLAAAMAATRVDGCVLAGGRDAQALAAESGAAWLDDGNADSMAAAVNRAAEWLSRQGADTMLVLPGDLPGLQAADIDALLARHCGAVTLCRAARDGGTNALVLTPPTAIPAQFGIDSARRHLGAAAGAGLSCQQLVLPAFASDIDTPVDLPLAAGLGLPGMHASGPLAPALAP